MTDISESIADQQRTQWERSYFEDPEMFGDQPSLPSMYAAIIFHDEGKTDILELGPGQGRDTLYFLQQGLNVWALDYAEQGLLKIEELAKTMKEKPEFGSLTTIRHDLRFSLPFPDNFFDDKQIDELAYGFDILDRFNFQEEELPRELQRITFRKKLILGQHSARF